ncbi:MAG: hypothetical protein HQK70_07795 [Desulfamplus sp.]|nr:hypothetical protein [Desulfamplus sp.]
MVAANIFTNDSTFDDALSRSLIIAKNNALEAQRMAMDCAQLLSTSSDRLESIKNQGFFQRLKSKFSGAARESEIASKEDLLQMQKMSFRFLELINKNDVLLLDSMITVKNQLDYILADSIDTKQALSTLAKGLTEKFKSVERRIGDLEKTTELHNWLLTIEEFDYQEFPKYVRLLKLVSDFRDLKPKDWTINDIRCLKSAFRKNEINPSETVSIENFVKSIAIEIYPNRFFDEVNRLLISDSVDVKRVVADLSMPLISAMYQFSDRYLVNADVIARLVKRFPDVPAEETAASIILDIIKEHKIDISAEIEHQHLALELLNGVNLAKYFASSKGFMCCNPDCINHKQNKRYFEPGYCDECTSNLDLVD